VSVGGFVVTWCSGSTSFIKQSIGGAVYAQIVTPNGFDIGRNPLSDAALEK
jgi:hypothetical protein